MATFNINIKPVDIYAVFDTFSTTDLITTQNIDVLANDYLGVTPTTIFSIDTTGFTLGTIVNNITNIEFTPNGNIGTSQLKYTIKDNIGRTSTTTLTITTTI